jgi:hypothetical protein
VVSKGEDDQDGDGHGDDQMLRIGKVEREKQKSSRQRYN